MSLIQQINAACLACYPVLLEEWLPGGCLNNGEYVCKSPNGDYKFQIIVNIETGSWVTFPNGNSGPDPISLFSYVKKLPREKAKHELAEGLNIHKSISSIHNKQISTDENTEKWNIARKAFPRIIFPWDVLL